MSQPPQNYHDALEFLKAYRWLDAGEICSQAAIDLIKSKGDWLRGGELYEKSGLYYYRAAYQSETNDEFRKLMESSLRSYENASNLFEQVKEPRSRIKKLQCEAQVLYLKSWIEKDPSTRRELLDQCLETGRKSLNEWEKNGDKSGYLHACIDFISHLYARSELASDFKEVRDAIEEAIKCSERAINAVSEDEELHNIAQIRHLLSLLLLDKPMGVYESVERQQENMKISLENANEAYREAERLEDLYLIGRTSGVLGYVTFEINGDFEASSKLVRKQLESAEITRDNLSKAQANELLAYLTAWRTNTKDEDPALQISENKKALQFADDAIRYYKIISNPVTIAYVNHIGSYNHLARNEIKIDERIDLIKKGIDVAKKDLMEAKKTGSLLGVLYVLNELTYLLFRLMRSTKENYAKIRIIQETELIVGELIDISNRLQPFRYWNSSVFKQHSAMLKIELAKIEKNDDKKRKLLIQALTEGEECAKLSKMHLDVHPSNILSLDYALGLKYIGMLLNILFEATKDNSYLNRAIDVYSQALKIYENNDLTCRIAETHWEIATIYDKQGEFLNSAKEFEFASQHYKIATKKRPHLEQFYLDYSNYMQAWSEISHAKYNRLKKLYKKVKINYDKAAELHKLTTKWNYLYRNYLSWARLAEAEDLSQKDKPVEAKNLFKEIRDMFEESKKTIETHAKIIEEKDEQQMAATLIKASELRRDYCLGRMLLEEAIILDAKGEDAESSRKYDEVIRIFKAIMNTSETELEREEITPIIYLCEAWKMKTLAEAEDISEHYQKAAQLFEKAKEHSSTQDTRLLAQGHSYFCRALYESSQFVSTRNLDNYRASSKYLASAANYYVRAGYDRALEYSKGTQRLIDAYVYLDNANSETNPEQKAKYYTLAERVLEASADSFSKARYTAKSEEVKKILKNVRKEQRLVLSLAKVLNAPSISSTTASFNPLTPKNEYAVGLESFEHSNIQASMHLKSNEITSSDLLEVVIVLNNTGTRAASLAKIEGMIPDKFEADYVSSYYVFDEQYIDLKGKKLGPLSTEEITIRLSPLSKGEFTIKPRIIYIDDAGEFKSCEPDPVNVKISDIGLSGWLRGPRIRSSRKSGL